MDDIEYHEIDKSNISVSEPVSDEERKEKVFRQKIIKTLFADLPIEEMKFSVRTYRRLKNAGIRTVGELTKKSRADLMKIKYFGKNLQEEVIEKLRTVGLKLADE